MGGVILPGLLAFPWSLRRCQQRGFTLLELLIVVFIISLISSGFVKLMVGFGGATQSLENETKRLHRLLSLTAQEAILQGSEIGLLIEVDAYRFVSRGEKNWVIFAANDLLQRHTLPQNWRLELKQDEDDQVIPPVAPPEGGEEKDKKEQPIPSILFYASGEVTPFQLRMYAADHPEPSLIEAKENGEIMMRIQGSNE